jgi:hypothetical protein
LEEGERVEHLVADPGRHVEAQAGREDLGFLAGGES